MTVRQLKPGDLGMVVCSDGQERLAFCSEDALENRVWQFPDNTRRRVSDSRSRPLTVSELLDHGLGSEENPGDSNLVAHAIRELDLIGETDLEPPSMRRSVVDVVRVFADQGHSGSSAAFAADVLGKLLRFQPLSPITDDPDDWMEVGDGVWQCRRAGECFSSDGGRTYHRLDARHILVAAEPHKPPEPAGLGAVVRDRDGAAWVSVHAAESPLSGRWRRAAADRGWRPYRDIDVVEVLADGWVDTEEVSAR